MTTVRGGAATDVGRVRQMNEDRFLCTERVFAVADGVGGHQAGEVAAQTAVETLESAFTDATTDGLIQAVEEANHAVWELAQGASEKRGMGTTLAAVALVTDGGEDQLAIANVGDSRVYLFQQGELVRLTEDHSLVEELVREGQLTPEEASVHPQRSIITRALGMDPQVEVDSWQVVPYAGDRLLLCSDGLTNEVTDDRIAATLRRLDNPEEAAQDLVRQARANGGNDNITVLVVDVVDDGGRAEAASAALAADGRHRVGDDDRTAVVPATPSADTGTWGGSGSRSSSASSTTAGTGTDVTGTFARPSATPTPAPPPGWPGGGDGDRDRWTSRLTVRVAIFAAALVGIIAAALLIVGWYATNTYFVGLDGDRVAIFKGRPGGVLWFDPSLRQHTDLRVADIPPARVADLREGKEEPSKAEADRYVNNLRQEATNLRLSTTTTTPPTTTTTVPPDTTPPATQP